MDLNPVEMIKRGGEVIYELTRLVARAVRYVTWLELMRESL